MTLQSAFLKQIPADKKKKGKNQNQKTVLVDLK